MFLAITTVLSVTSLATAAVAPLPRYSQAVYGMESQRSTKLSPKYIQDMCDSYCKRAIADYGECLKASTSDSGRTCICGDKSDFMRSAMQCLRCGKTSRDTFGGALSTPLAMCNIRIVYNKNQSWNFKKINKDIEDFIGSAAAAAEASVSNSWHELKKREAVPEPEPAAKAEAAYIKSGHRIEKRIKMNLKHLKDGHIEHGDTKAKTDDKVLSAESDADAGVHKNNVIQGTSTTNAAFQTISVTNAPITSIRSTTASTTSSIAIPSNYIPMPGVVAAGIA